MGWRKRWGHLDAAHRFYVICFCFCNFATAFLKQPRATKKEYGAVESRKKLWNRVAQWGGAVAVFVVSFAIVGRAEEPKERGWIRWSGGLQLIGEYNQQRGSGAFYRYPFANRWTGRIILSAKLTLFDQIQLPFQLRLTNREVGYQQPFNQFGASLQLTRWLRLYGGYFSLAFSPLTFGDQRILGGGVELSPGPFYLGFLYGLGRHARLPQGAFQGEYDRWFWAVKTGFRLSGGTSLLLTLMHAIDDSTSLPDTVALPAMENLAGSLHLTAPITSFLQFQGEVAVAAYTRDQRFPQTTAAENFPAWLFVPRHSTSVDGAAKAELLLKPGPLWNVRLKGEWIGPGYITLGYTQLINDIARITVAPTVQLFQSRLIVSGSIGIQRNNLLQDKLATTRRLIGSLNLSAQLAPGLSLSAAYTNYGIRSNHSNDTLRISTISQMLNITPSWQFRTGRINHSLNLGYAYSNVSDRNVLTAQQQRFQGHSLTFAYSLQLPPSWVLTTTIFGSKNEAGENPAPSMLNISETVRTRLWERWDITASVGYGMQEIAAQRSENWFARLSTYYHLQPYGRIALLLLWQSTTSDTTNAEFLRLALTYSVNW